jgi:hypothetical protein
MREEEKRDRAHAIKHIDVPNHVDKKAYARVYHNNLVDQEVELEMNKAYDDVIGKEKPKKRISNEYDLGDW